MEKGKVIIDKATRIIDMMISRGVSKIICKREIKQWAKTSGFTLKRLGGENAWKEKWGVLQSKLNVDYYRYYSQYQGENVNLCPDDIMHNIITPIMNPKRFVSTYEDKCLFDKVLSSSFKERVTPPTILRNVLGAYYDIDYRPVARATVDNLLSKCKYERIVIKPSIDSSSGHSILFATQNNKGEYLIEDSTKVDLSFLESVYGRNFVIQKSVEQSDFMAQFCSTSINTIRMLVYRSFVSNKPVVLHAFMRIGKQGSLVDNIHSGGTFVGVRQDGTLNKACVNTNTLPMKEFNGIDFSCENFIIPNYDEVKDFACRVAMTMPHLHLFSLDVMLDKGNNPMLIEYNLTGFGVRGYQFTSGPVFREYTDEIINYCSKHLSEASRIYLAF